MCVWMINVTLSPQTVRAHKYFSLLGKVNPMTSLSHATFDGCRNVSLTLLVELLCRDSDLNLLRLWNCPQASSNNETVSFSFFCVVSITKQPL